MSEPDNAADRPAIEGFSDRLREAIQRAGGASAVSRRSRVALSTLNDYLKGKEARFTRVAALAAACNVSLDWLAGVSPPSESLPHIAILKPDVLNAKAHFWALFVLIRSCQEFHEQMNLVPTLADVLAWISNAYIQSQSLPDNRIEFKSPKETGS